MINMNGKTLDEKTNKLVPCTLWSSNSGHTVSITVGSRGFEMVRPEILFHSANSFTITGFVMKENTKDINIYESKSFLIKV